MNSMLQITIFYVLILGVMLLPSYFINKKKKQKQQDLIDSFKVGDKVTTIGGIRGEIVAVLTDTVEVKVDKGVRITFKKTAIVEVIK